MGFFFSLSLLPMVLGSPELKEDTALAVIVCSFLNSDNLGQLAADWVLASLSLCSPRKFFKAPTLALPPQAPRPSHCRACCSWAMMQSIFKGQRPFPTLTQAKAQMHIKAESTALHVTTAPTWLLSP